MMREQATAGNKKGRTRGSGPVLRSWPVRLLLATFDENPLARHDRYRANLLGGWHKRQIAKNLGGAHAGLACEGLESLLDWPV